MTPSPIDELVALVARLHAPEPDGCPWCLAQTHETLRRALIEESHEVADAIDREDPAALAEELGDVLLLVLTHAHLASEAGHFTFDDVVQGAIEKAVRRHPHIFGDAQASTPEEVLQQWEAIKQSERPANSSLLDGIPRSLPALERAEQLQGRAASVGFDWPDVQGVIAKVLEEVRELQAAGDATERQDELGDLLFSLVNLGRRLGLPAEAALHGTNDKFARRFADLEEACRQRGVQPQDLTLDELDALWDQAKASESET